MKRLATTIYNGFDFVDTRTAQLKRINAIDSFFRHFTSANQRVRCFDNSILESISMYQIQVFQARFDFQLNQDFLQNATYICSAPSNMSESALDHSQAII